MQVAPFHHKAARCRHFPINLFFPDRGESSAPALRVCDTCPLADACLEYAIVNNEQHGVWGGTTVRQRRTIRRQWIAAGRIAPSTQARTPDGTRCAKAVG